MVCLTLLVVIILLQIIVENKVLYPLLFLLLGLLLILHGNGEGRIGWQVDVASLWRNHSVR